jgi:hypothetical protein
MTAVHKPPLEDGTPYIKKPFDLDELERALGDALATSLPERPSAPVRSRSSRARSTIVSGAREDWSRGCAQRASEAAPSTSSTRCSTISQRASAPHGTASDHSGDLIPEVVVAGLPSDEAEGEAYALSVLVGAVAVSVVALWPPVSAGFLSPPHAIVTESGMTIIARARTIRIAAS